MKCLDPCRNLLAGRFLLCVSLTLFFLGLVTDNTTAQNRGRSIAGKITSATGSPISNAKLTIKNLTTGAITDILGNDNGTFIVSDLVPAKYEITADAPGFTAARANVTITSDADQVVSIILYSVRDTGQSVSGVINSKSV